MIVDGVRRASDALGDDADRLSFEEMVEDGLLSECEPGESSEMVVGELVLSECIDVEGAACFEGERGQGFSEQHRIEQGAGCVGLCERDEAWDSGERSCD